MRASRRACGALAPPTPAAADLLVAERIWYDRFHSRPIWDGFSGLDQELVTGRAELEAALTAQADKWIAYTDSVDVDGEFSYTNTRGDPMTGPRGPLLAHVFNHGTHHRGQISAGLGVLGFKEYPAMDLLYFLRPDA